MGSACCSKSSVTTNSMLNIKSSTVVPATASPKKSRSIFHYTEDTETTFLELSFAKSRKIIKWKRGEIIGEGAYAKVYQCMNTETGELMAAKHFTVRHTQFSDEPKKVEREYLSLKREVLLLRDLDHPNIVKYIQTDLSPDRDSIDVLIEFIPGGSLKHLLSHYGALEESVISTYARQLLSGLSYLHKHNVIHRDLKSANILLTTAGVIKLTDFGSSKRMDSMNLTLTKSLKGSPYWMAPEISAKKGHSVSADIWSLGCVVIEMATGHPPWSNYSHSSREVMRLIETEGSTQYTDLPDFPKGSPALVSFVRCCLQRDPSARPTAAQLLSHPFVEGKFQEGVFEYEKTGSCGISLESTEKTLGVSVTRDREEIKEEIVEEDSRIY